MTQFWPKLVLCAVFAAAASAVAADDEKKPAKPPADFSAYAKGGEMSGIVVTGDAEKVTIRVPRTVPGRGRGRPKQEHTDYDFKFAEGGLVRWKKLPPKTGADGKKASHTPKEQEEFRKPAGAPGFAATGDDLKPGVLVELHLLRPKEIKADKAKPEDLLIKYAFITGEAASVPVPDKKDMPAKKAPEKKDEKKAPEKKDEKKAEAK